MKLGKYYSDEGIYEFDGKHYKPRWFANQLKIGIPEVYTMCIAGFDGGSTGLAQTILVTCNIPGMMKCDELRKHYDGIYAQSQLHAYAPGVAGQLPAWTNPWQQLNNLLIHEYAGGKIAWVRPGDFANDIYMFMVDCAAPEETPVPVPLPDPIPDTIPDSDVVAGDYHVTGKIWFMDVDLHVTNTQ